MNGRFMQFDRWPTGTKLLLMLSAALLPLGLALAWAAQGSLQDANNANRAAAEEQGRAAALAIESLIARNAMALSVAANGAFRRNPADPCVEASKSLALTPAIANRFVIRRADAGVICTHGDIQPQANDTIVAPGDVRLWVSPAQKRVDFRVGVVGGMATGELNLDELRASVKAIAADAYRVAVGDGAAQLAVVDKRPVTSIGRQTLRRTYDIAGGQLRIDTAIAVEKTTLFDQAAVYLPLLMWVVAAFLSWLLVRTSFIQPLGRLKRAVIDFQPGDGQIQLPERLGLATEIRELGQAFERSVARIEESERQMADALDGQRKLVREVHHRVKNNLQVVASLLNIHGRSATTPEARAAYAAIGRRVDALAVVHRNHFAEVEESRGIALRPLLVELSATLRASAPDDARATPIQLDIDNLHTTQDAAVATAFFITEVVEFAMLAKPGVAIEIELRRTSELAARLTMSSDALSKEAQEDPDRVQFGRIIGGLARQLRSPLDERIGRLSVDIPVFPD